MTTAAAAAAALFACAERMYDGADKRRAKIQGARRVPEKTLFALALLLGSAGALFAMRVFHHKTRHWYFKFGIPAILLAQIALGVFVYVRFFAA